MLNGGRYQGRQLISENWIQEATHASELAPYYGYLWWVDSNSNHFNYATTGDRGQMLIVFPGLELIFARRQSCDISSDSIRMRWFGPDFINLISDIVL